jgi:tetratricopeptide (TPR) repeat protein
MRAALLLAALLVAEADPPGPHAAPGAPAGERQALDAIYAQIAKRQFAEAQAALRPIALAVQKDVQAASGVKLAPAAEAALRLRVGEVVFQQGLLEARLGRKQDALDLLRKADGYGFPPLDSPLMALAAECLLELEEPALAAQAYREIVKARPADGEARLRLGAALYAAGQLDASAAELEELLRRDPARPQAHYYLGAVRLDQKRPDSAREHLAQELQRDPRCAPCLAKLARLAYLAGDDAGCEGWLGKAAAIDPELVATHLVYGMLYNREAKPALAVQHLLRVVERAPGYATARYQLALAYQRQGEVDKAREQREVYDRLLREQKARSLGVRGSGE